MGNTYRGASFGKVADPNLQFCIFSKECTPLQTSFNWFVYILGAPPSKQTSKKKVTTLKFTVCYIAIIHFQPLQLVRIKTKLNRLINSVCFRMRSITKKEKHGNYIVKIYNEMYITSYMKYPVKSKIHGKYRNTWYLENIV